MKSIKVNYENLSKFFTTFSVQTNRRCIYFLLYLMFKDIRRESIFVEGLKQDAKVKEELIKFSLDEIREFDFDKWLGTLQNEKVISIEDV